MAEGERLFHAPAWADLDDWLALGWIVPRNQLICWRVVEYGPHVEWICTHCPPVYPTSYKGRRNDPRDQ